MPELVADKDYFADENGKLVGEDQARVLVARKGTAISEAAAERYGLKLKTAETYDAVADHAAKHGGETDAEAAVKRTAMLDGEQDPDGPPVEGERDGVKSTDAAPATKAVSKAPSNKGA